MRIRKIILDNWTLILYFALSIFAIVPLFSSGFSIYFFLKSFFGKIPALAAAVSYLYFPYHALDIYVRGDVAEFFAYVFLPLVLLGLYKIHELGKFNKFYVVLASLSLAAVII